MGIYNNCANIERHIKHRVERIKTWCLSVVIFERRESVKPWETGFALLVGVGVSYTRITMCHEKIENNIFNRKIRQTDLTYIDFRSVKGRASAPENFCVQKRSN